MEWWYLGEIKLMPIDWAPPGWSPCDGRLMNLEQNSALHSLIGTTHGGDGKTTFALPKLEPFQGINPYIATTGVFPRRQ